MLGTPPPRTPGERGTAGGSGQHSQTQPRPGASSPARPQAPAGGPGQAGGGLKATTRAQGTRQGEGSRHRRSIREAQPPSSSAWLPRYRPPSATNREGRNLPPGAEGAPDTTTGLRPGTKGAVSQRNSPAGTPGTQRTGPGRRRRRYSPRAAPGASPAEGAGPPCALAPPPGRRPPARAGKRGGAGRFASSSAGVVGPPPQAQLPLPGGRWGRKVAGWEGARVPAEALLSPG